MYYLSVIIFVIILCFVLFVYAYFSLLFHELGHVLAGKLVGVNPSLVQIGSGKKIGSLYFLNTKFTFRYFPNAGLTLGTFTRLSRLKFKIFIFALGGPFIQILIILIFFQFLYADASDKIRIVLIPFILYEAFMVTLNLFPREIMLYGEKYPSDGAKIAALFFIMIKKWKH